MFLYSIQSGRELRNRTIQLVRFQFFNDAKLIKFHQNPKFLTPSFYQHQKHPFWNWCADNFEQTFVVPGNHELYKYFDINNLTEGWTEEIRANISAVYNKVIHLNDIDLILSTLWAKIHATEAYYVEHGVTDFRRIRNGETLLSWDRFNDEHERCVEFIKHSIEQSTARKRVVVTHHVPSFELMAKEFKGSLINGAFTSDLNLLIEAYPIDYWIYGHSHRNIDGKIAGTKMRSNQLGYVFANEISTFMPDKFIEL